MEMTYDQAKLEAFHVLVPEHGDVFMESSKYKYTILQAMKPRWVSFFHVSSGQKHSVMLSEWWLQLNRRVLERAELNDLRRS